MHWLWVILIGFLVGTIAKVIFPGKQGMGFIMTTLLGIGGAWVGSFLMGIVGYSRPAGFVGSVIGALLILLIARKLAPAT